MEKLLKVVLKIKLKNDEIKIIHFDQVTDLFIDYAKNKLSLFSYTDGVDFNYHFRPTGKEHEQEATEILDIQITKKEEE